MVACIRGDGKRLSMFWIDHKRKGQKPLPHQMLISKEERVAGMNLNLMKEWSEFALQHMKRGDVLILDRLSSHLNKAVISMFEKKDVIYLLLPPKGSLLLSPLDRGFFGVFEKKYRDQLSRTSRFENDRKLKTANSEYIHSIQTENVVKFFRDCGLDSSIQLEKIQKNDERERLEESSIIKI